MDWFVWKEKEFDMRLFLLFLTDFIITSFYDIS